MEHITDFNMSLSILLKNVKQRTCSNRNCEIKYDLQQRMEQIKKYSRTTKAGNYCCDKCWIVSTNGIDPTTKEADITR